MFCEAELPHTHTLSLSGSVCVCVSLSVIERGPMSHAETMTVCRHEECEKQGKREEESAEGKWKKVILQKVIFLYSS